MKNQQTKNIFRVMMAICLMTLSACASLPGKQSQNIDGTNYSYARQGTGKVNVVFVTGLGSVMDSAWGEVFEEVAGFAPVFAYNRPGYGDSITQTQKNNQAAQKVAGSVADMVLPGASLGIDLIRAAARPSETPEPISGNQVASQLHRLLNNAGIKPPYILVGHSLGGMYIQSFTHAYPHEVAGLVLVDSRPVEMTRLCDEQIGKGACLPPAMMINLMPDFVQAEYYGMALTEEQLRKAGPLPNIPVTVLASTEKQFGVPDGVVALKIKLQKQDADKLPQGRFIRAEKSGHFIQHDKPELVVGEIRRMLGRPRANAVSNR